MSGTVNRLTITTPDTGEVVLRGELDAHSAPGLLERLVTGASAGAVDVIVDMSEVTFVDSSGLRVLLDFDQQIAATSQRLVLRSPSDTFVRLLDIAGLTGHFTIAA